MQRPQGGSVSGGNSTEPTEPGEREGRVQSGEMKPGSSQLTIPSAWAVTELTFTPGGRGHTAGCSGSGVSQLDWCVWKASASALWM